MIDVDAARKDLPHEVLMQLSEEHKLTKKDRLVISVLEECEGSANLDQLIVGLYQLHGEISRRGPLTQKLNKMVHAKKLDRASHGVYKLPAPTEPTDQEEEKPEQEPAAAVATLRSEDKVATGSMGHVKPSPAGESSEAFVSKAEEENDGICANCTKPLKKNACILYDDAFFCTHSCKREYASI